MTADVTKGRRPNRRRRTDEKIAQAALGLMRKAGPDGITMEAVAAAAGISKVTLYSRYANRDELLRGLAQSLATPALEVLQVPHFPAAEADLEGALLALGRMVADQAAPALLGRVLTGSEASMSEWRDTLIGPQMRTLRAYFTRGVEEGTVRSDLDVTLVVELIVGGLVIDDALHGTVPEDWARRMAALLWPRIAVEP